MKKHFLYCLSLFATAPLFADPAITQVIVRQQWPWSTDIKVEYVLTGVDGEHPVNLQVSAYNGDVALPANRLEESIKGARYGLNESGVGSFLIDPVKAFGQEKVALANFKVKLSLAASDANANEVLYKIYDLTAESGTFPCTNVTRADLKNGLYGAFETEYSNLDSTFSTGLSDVLIWTGVTNYPGAKTTKLVMRKIPAGSFSMGQTGGTFTGSDNAEKVHLVTLTKGFYIGVYPVTQEQYRKLTRGAWSGSGHQGDELPVENAYYADFQSVVTNAIADNLGVSVNFPTEAQWEYACRAGTTSELYNGKPLSVNGVTQTANIVPIAWNGTGTDETTHEVGLKLPNAYGLYDMIGNVYEACRDYWTAAANVPGYSDGNLATDPCVDAVMSDTPDANNINRYVVRGGSFGLNNFLVTSAGRYGTAGKWTAYGFRLAFTVNE